MSLKTETAVGLFIIAAIGVFLYMSFRIGSFRFDAGNYSHYIILFDDISGVSKKSDVKIAGVKIGFVERTELDHDEGRVRAYIMILRHYRLHSNAYAQVRQDGLLGTKYLEIMPGDPSEPLLEPGATLTEQGREPVSIDTILGQVKTIATHIESVTGSLSEVLGGPEGTERLRETMVNINSMSGRLASFAQSLDTVITDNQQDIAGIITDVRQVARELREQIPVIQQNIERIAGVVDRDFNRIASNLEDTAEPLKNVVQKINDGRGILGQLINDDAAYKDLKFAVQGVKNYFAKIDKLSLVFDTHTETMFSKAEHASWRDSKGYFNIRLYPTEDYFYLVGLVGSRKGRVERVEDYIEWYDECGSPILPSVAVERTGSSYFPSHSSDKRFVRNTFLFNVQVGKIFGNMAFRGGIFDNQGGMGVDFELPLEHDRLRWVSTFELYDFWGQNRINDNRPHLKWLNKLFVSENLYFTIGADDFVSRFNKSAFVGVGARFADDDLKYYASSARIGG